MNEFETKESNTNENKGLLLSVVGVLTLIVAIAGATYAFFQATDTAEGISGTAATAGLTLTVSPVYPAQGADTSGQLIPQDGPAINAAAAAGCLDGNNTVCQVYSITVQNTGSTPVELNGTILFGGIENMPNLVYATSSSSTSGYATTGTTASTTATPLQSNLTLAAGATSQPHYVVIWIEETGSVQTDSGTYTATVTYNASNGKGVTSTIVAND